MSNHEEQLQRQFTCEQPGRAAKASMITCEQKMFNKEEHLRTNSLGEKSFVCKYCCRRRPRRSELQNLEEPRAPASGKSSSTIPRLHLFSTIFTISVCFKLLQIGILMVILLALSSFQLSRHTIKPLQIRTLEVPNFPLP
jgi:hypothetical protein